MELVVFLKQVLDNTRFATDGQGHPKPDVPTMLNPLDDYALELALRLKEADSGAHRLTVISAGPLSVKDLLKKAIAAGADQAVLVQDDAITTRDGLSRAKLLHASIKTLEAKGLLASSTSEVIYCFGQKALDTGAGETGPAFAALLDLPSLGQVKSAVWDESRVQITRAADSGLETHLLSAPAVLCAMKGEHELRTANIKGVMRANKTEIPVWTLSDIGLEGLSAGLMPTSVVDRVAKPAGKTLQPASPSEAAEAIVSYLSSLQVV